MSSITKCNYCTLQRLGEQAKISGEIVILVPAPAVPYFNHAVEARTAHKHSNLGRIVAVIPTAAFPEIGTLLLKNEAYRRETRFVAWFAQLPEQCECT